MAKETTYKFESPVFYTFNDALIVVHLIRKEIASCGVVSVWKFFNDFCGIHNITEETAKYAWTSIPKTGLYLPASVHGISGFWSLNLPQPIELTEEQADSLHRLEGFKR